MLNDPLITVLVPAYNQEKLIAETIESVLKQTYKRLQIIIGDDCSTDNTYSIIEKYAATDNRIEAYQNNRNIGICGNFNKLFDLVKGEYVVFFSGDDIMLADKIKIQLACFKSNDKIVLVHHNAKIINESAANHTTHLGNRLPVMSPLDYSLNANFFHYKKFAGFLPTSSMARSTYYLQSRYNNSLQYKHELLFFLENYYADPQGEWFYIKEPLMYYRIHDGNFTNNPEFSKYINKEKTDSPLLAREKCPLLKAKIEKHLDFVYYEKLLLNFYNNETDRENAADYYNGQMKGLAKFYLTIAKGLKKAGLYWWYSSFLFHLIYKPVYLIRFKLIRKRIL